MTSGPLQGEVLTTQAVGLASDTPRGTLPGVLTRPSSPTGAVACMSLPPLQGDSHTGHFLPWQEVTALG